MFKCGVLVLLDIWYRVSCPHWSVVVMSALMLACYSRCSHIQLHCSGALIGMTCMYMLPCCMLEPVACGRDDEREQQVARLTVKSNRLHELVSGYDAVVHPALMRRLDCNAFTEVGMYSSHAVERVTIDDWLASRC